MKDLTDPHLGRMVDEMNIRGCSKKSIDSYIGALRRFKKTHEGPLQDLEVEDARAYLVSLKSRGRGASTLNQAQAAFKFLFKHVLRRVENLDELPTHKRSKRIPGVLARSQVRNLFGEVKNIKHRTFTMTLYSAGLRVSEAAHLKIHDIDSTRMRILVQGGKGDKSRETILSHVLLDQLRSYWVIQRPKQWLFPGKDPAKPIHTATIQRVIRQAGVDAGIRKSVTPHILRHSFATHLLENGTPLPYIQRCLGHSSIKTTMIYLKVTSEGLGKIVSPLDQLGL